MKTIEQQLTDMRKAYLKKIYEGQPESVVENATKNLHLLNFASVTEFEEWAQQTFNEDPKRQASEEELDQVMGAMFIGGVERDGRSKSERDLDEIMKLI